MVLILGGEKPRKLNKTKLLDKRAFGRISENDSLQGFFPHFQWLSIMVHWVTNMCNSITCCLFFFYLESLLITLIKAPFSSFSLWLSAFRSGNIYRWKIKKKFCFNKKIKYLLLINVIFSPQDTWKSFVGYIYF